MKWPERLTIIRHGESDYNRLRQLKESDPLYSEFKSAYEKRSEDPKRTKELAEQLIEQGKFILGVGDHDTPLS